jgi:hypothetical protein
VLSLVSVAAKRAGSRNRDSAQTRYKSRRARQLRARREKRTAGVHAWCATFVAAEPVARRPHADFEKVERVERGHPRVSIPLRGPSDQTRDLLQLPDPRIGEKGIKEPPRSLYVTRQHPDDQSGGAGRDDTIALLTDVSAEPRLASGHRGRATPSSSLVTSESPDRPPVGG